VSLMCAPGTEHNICLHAFQKGTRLTAARVTEYIGYLEKGQIPPKV